MQTGELGVFKVIGKEAIEEGEQAEEEEKAEKEEEEEEKEDEEEEEEGEEEEEEEENGGHTTYFHMYLLCHILIVWCRTDTTLSTVCIDCTV